MTQEHPISVEGKTIFITGAFGLIGKEISKGFLNLGARVILADVNESAIQSLQDEFSSIWNPSQFSIQHLDITSELSIQNAIDETIHKFGKLDVLINNAAIDAKFDQDNTSKINNSRFENYPLELLEKSIDVNLTGMIRMTQAACRQMLNQGQGNIINVASTYSMVAPNQSLYDFGDGEEIRFKPIDYIATKSFVPNFTRYIATFYAKEGIRCNAIVPHAIFNNHSEKFTRNFAKLSPLGRMSEKNELVGPFLLLASEGSSYMTGSILTVDGGWTAW